MTAATPGREELLALIDEIEINRRIGADQKFSEQESTVIEYALRLAAKPADEGLYLVWSNQHSAWWRPSRAGYTDDVKLAGRYSRAEAISISFQGRDGWDSPKGVPDELAIAERDVPVFTTSTTGEPKP